MDKIKLYKVHQIFHELYPETDVVDIHKRITGYMFLTDVDYVYFNDELDKTLFDGEEEEVKEVISKPGLDELTPKRLLDMPKKELLMVHLRMHQLYNGSYKDKEKIIKIHKLVVGAMLLRGINHTIKDDLDKTIFLKKSLDSMLWIPEFIQLTGSVVNATKNNPNDVDIVAKANVDKNGQLYIKLDAPLKLKLENFIRNFVGKKNLPIHWSANQYGSNTSYLPLFSLYLVPHPPQIKHSDNEYVEQILNKAIESDMKVQAERSKKDDTVVPGRFYYPMKTSIDPVIGYHKGERYSVEQGFKAFKDLVSVRHVKGVYFEEKLDGIFTMWHYIKGKLIVYTDGGKVITDKLPNFEKQAKELFGNHTVVLEGELQRWENGKHIPREDVFSLIGSEKGSDKSLFVSVFDCLYLDKDIHNENYTVRRKALDSLVKGKVPELEEIKPDTKSKFVLLPTYYCDTYYKEMELDAKKYLQHCFDIKSSEGCMMKVLPYKHSLTGTSKELIKVKKYADFHAIVLSREDTKTSGVYNYWFGLSFTPQDKIDLKTVVTVGNNKYTKVGKTFNSTLNLKPGNIITVEFHTLNVYTDKNSGLVRLASYENHLKEFDPDESDPDDVSETINIAKEADLLVYKSVSNQGPFIFVSKDKDPYTTSPSEDATWKYMHHVHLIGKGAHVDFRIQWGVSHSPKFMIGWTWLVKRKDRSFPEIVSSVKQAKEYINNPKYWKINLKTFEFGMRKLSNGIVRRTGLMAIPKQTEPLPWFNFQGKVNPGQVGAGVKVPGVLVIVNKGNIFYGAAKNYFHEYFIESGKGVGRYVTRLLPQKAISKDFVYKVNEDIDVDYLPESKPQHVRSGFTWIVIQATDLTPYILSRGAVNSGWIAPQGYSCLPSSVRTKVPKEFQYWGFSDTKKRRDTRNELLKRFKINKESGKLVER